MRARYCTDCGCPVPRPDGSDAVAVCPECGREDARQPAVSAAGILTREASEGPEVLLIRRRPDVQEGAGLYCLPGKLVGWGQGSRDAVREAFETQTGLRIEVRSSYDVHDSLADPQRPSVGTWFRVEQVDGEPQAGADADGVAYFPLSRLPELAFAGDRLILERLSDDLQDTQQRVVATNMSVRLQRRKERYRELLDAYTNELMRGAWINDLHERLSAGDDMASITSIAATQLASRVEVDAVRIWYVGPPDRCETCPWTEHCSHERCLHLIASSDNELEGDDEDEGYTPTEVRPEEERIPLNRGVPAADVALDDAPMRAELPGAGALPRRFEGFPLSTKGETPGVLGLISRRPMEPNARRLFEVVARHIGTLTANARLVEDLSLANQVKLGFIQRMSHELKTPLTAILGYSELLREALAAEGHTMGADGAATIEQSGRKLLDIVEMILEVAKLQSGSVRFRRENVNVVEVVEELVLRNQKNVNTGVELKVVPPELGPGDPQPTVWADAKRTRQAIGHLLSNALKFTAEGSVTIRILPGPEEIVVEVADTGIGIAPEYHKMIFEAFCQVSEKIHLDYGGLGIGLSMASILIEQQGGRIWVDSHPGIGSTFSFALPRHASSHKRRGTTDRIARKVSG